MEENSTRTRKREEENPKLTITIRRSKKSLDNIPQEIVHDILLKRLPVKSLLLSKDVCKSWRGLISDPKFVKSHLNLATKKGDNVIYCHISRDPNSGGTISFSLSYINREASEVKTVKRDVPFTCLFQGYATLSNCFFQVLGSCNGLVLIGFSYLALLWNPSTGECSKHVTSCGGLQLHERYPPCYITGLAYDSSVDEYKAVVLKSKYNDAGLHMFVYSSTSRTENRCWKKVDVKVHEFPYSIKYVSPLGMTVNGAPHWVVNSSKSRSSSRHIIIYFDMVEEKFKKLPTPPPQSWNQMLRNIAVLGGCLCAILYTFNDIHRFRDGDFDVWVMKEYGVKESWTKLFGIRMSSNPLSLRPLGFTKDGDEVVLLINRSKLVAYNLRTKEEKLIVSTNIKSGAVYVESLVSPKCSCEKTGVPTY